MIPSGYKEDVVYSAIPTNGNGDLSFTRASNGTRVNSSGLVEVCPWNLQTYSEDFTNGTYTVNQASITSNATTAPNGTLTADKLVENTANDQHFLYFTSQQIAYNETRISVYAKAGGRTNLLMWESAITNAQCLFNLSTGVVSSSSSGNAANLSTTVGQIDDAGNGWYRCSFNYSTSSGGGTIRLQLYTTTTSYTGDGTSGVFLWGSQENIGSTAKPYFHTTDRLNVPRLTYQNGGGGCPSLLLEKQSTNIVTYSEQFDNAAWSLSGVTVSANQTTSPDGTTNADKLIESSANALHEIYQAQSLTNGVTYTNTIYAKSGERTQIAINFVSGGFGQGANVIADLSAGTLGTVSNYGSVTGSTATITNVGNGWYRISLTMTPATTETFYADYSPALNGNITYQGNGTSGVYIWGAQIEISSYPTSYIPTTSSSATRVADACFKTGISSLIGQTEGVVFWDIEVETLSATGNENILNLDAGSFGDTIYFIKGSAGGITAEVYAGATVQCSFSYSLPSVGRYKMALAYKANDFAFYVNGVSRGTDSSGTVPATSRFQMGNGVFGSSDGKVNQAVLFTTRLTNAELASLTTI